jgi:hypothetical protein
MIAGGRIADHPKAMGEDVVGVEELDVDKKRSTVDRPIGPNPVSHFHLAAVNLSPLKPLSIPRRTHTYMEDGRPLKHRLLDRLPFVRRSLEEARPAVPDENDPPATPPWPPSPTPVIKQRRRKGSLRKTILTGGHYPPPIGARPQHHQQQHADATRGSRVAAASGPTGAHDDAPSTPPPLSSSAEDPSPRRKYGSTTDDDADADSLLLPPLRRPSLSYAAGS